MLTMLAYNNCYAHSSRWRLTEWVEYISLTLMAWWAWSRQSTRRYLAFCPLSMLAGRTLCGGTTIEKLAMQFNGNINMGTRDVAMAYIALKHEGG